MNLTICKCYNELMSTKLTQLANLIRYEIITSTTAAGSGHPSSSLSAVELMTTLFFDNHFHYDFDNPKYIFNDRVIFSKGHAAPLLYSLYKAAGKLTHEELLTLRQFDSNLEGHPTPHLKYVDVSTGSLGQGLSVGFGMALGIKLQLKQIAKTEQSAKLNPKVWVLLGDSEFAEGQIWEALQLASHYQLDNLIGILDVNRLGQRGETMLGWDIDTYQKRISSFGWNTILIEKGNDIAEVQKAFESLDSLPKDKPTMIIAKTKKGAGISSIEDKDGWHGKPLTKEMLEVATNELGKIDMNLVGNVLTPVIMEDSTSNDLAVKIDVENLTIDGKAATREAYGEAITHISKDPRVVVLDAETSNSTYAMTIKDVDAGRFFEMFIAEQNMISAALGMSKVGLIPFSSTFAAFLARAYDQIRMCQYSDPNVKIIGSHAGVSIGSDGSSQMALEDIAMMRALLESTVLYPSDKISTIKLVDTMRTLTGISYMRLTREKTPILYSQSEEFPIGGSKVLQSSSEDKAVVVAAGITVHEALKAYTQLKQQGISISIIDAYSVKPLDAKTITQYAKRTGHVIVVEDHYPDGGLGDAVLKELQGLDVKYTHLAVTKIPHSGTPEELLRFEEIDAQAIQEAVLG